MLDLSKPAAVTAVFGPAVIPVKVSTSGKGRVACTPSCSKRFSAGTRLTLRAIPAKGWKFASWGGACTGTRLDLHAEDGLRGGRARELQEEALSQSRSSV